MSIYGNTLLAFAEQMINVDYFQQVARVGSGYDKLGESRSIRCILQSGRGKEMFGSSGRLAQHSAWRSLAVSDKEDLWVVEPLVLGWYILHPFTGKVMVIDKENSWAREAGFYAYTIELVVGEDGVNKTEALTFNRGTY